MRFTYQMRRCWAMLAAFGGLVGATGVQGQTAPIVRTSYETDSHGTIYIQVRLNGTTDARFMLDTGSNTFLSDALLKKAGVKAHPVIGADGRPSVFDGGAPVTAASVTIMVTNTPIKIVGDIMVLPSQAIRNMGVVCDGILGVDSLERLCLLISPINRQLAFMPAGNLDSEGLHRFGMDSVKPVLMIKNPIGFYEIPVSFPNLHDLPMMVDTGSEFTKAPKDVAQQIGKAWIDGGHIETAQGTFKVYSMRLDTFTVGDSEVHGQKLLYSDQPAGPPLPPLGRDFLMRFEVLLDFPGCKAYLRPQATFPGISPFARRLLGEDTVVPTHEVTFPYGGQTLRAGERTDYKAGYSVLFPMTDSYADYTIKQNPPPPGTVGKPVEIPIEIMKGAILVRASIDGKPVRMALDTGSVCSWLTTGAAKRLAMHTTTVVIEMVKVETAFFNRIALSPQAPEFLAYCDGFIADKPDFYHLTSEALPENVDGVLGLDYLSTQTFGLDLSKHALVLWPWASNEKERMGWVAPGSATTPGRVIVIPLTHMADDWFFASARIGSQTLKLVVDTGYSAACRLPDNISFEQYGLDVPRPSPADPKSLRADMTLRAREGVLRSMTLSGLTLPSLSAAYVQAEGAQSIPLLGMEVFRGRRLLFDLPHNKLYVSGMVIK